MTDDKFVQVNQNYLTINTAKLSPAFYEKYEDMEDVDYVLPGDSNASFIMPLDDYYQSAGAMTMVSGSLSDIDMVKKDSLISGKPADSQRGIIIDKMVIDNILSNYEVQQVGISSYEDFVGRKLELNRLGEFTISGITDQGSPSIYTEKDLFIDILDVYKRQQLPGSRARSQVVSSNQQKCLIDTGGHVVFARCG